MLHCLVWSGKTCLCLDTQIIPKFLLFAGRFIVTCQFTFSLALWRKVPWRFTGFWWFYPGVLGSLVSILPLFVAPMSWLRISLFYGVRCRICIHMALYTIRRTSYSWAHLSAVFFWSFSEGWYGPIAMFIVVFWTCPVSLTIWTGTFSVRFIDICRLSWWQLATAAHC